MPEIDPFGMNEPDVPATSPGSSAATGVPLAPHFHCVLCPDTRVALDDVALTFPSGRVICARCFARETETERALDATLRTQFRAVLRRIIDASAPDASAHGCMACNESVEGALFAVQIAGFGWLCDACADSPVGVAIQHSPRVAEQVGEPYRCLCCDEGTRLYLANYRYHRSGEFAGLGLCADCAKTPIGQKLNADADFLRAMIAARGL